MSESLYVQIEPSKIKQTKKLPTTPKIHTTSKIHTPSKTPTPSPASKKIFTKTPKKHSQNIKSFFPPAPIRDKDFVLLLDDDINILTEKRKSEGQEKGAEKEDIEMYKKMGFSTTTKTTTTTTTTTIIENFFTPISPSKRALSNNVTDGSESEDEKRMAKKQKEGETKKKRRSRRSRKEIESEQSERSERGQVMQIDSFFRTIREQKTVQQDVSVGRVFNQIRGEKEYNFEDIDSSDDEADEDSDIRRYGKLRSNYSVNNQKQVNGKEAEDIADLLLCDTEPEGGSTDGESGNEKEKESESESEKESTVVEENRRNSYGGEGTKKVKERRRRRKSAPMGNKTKQSRRVEREKREAKQFEEVKQMIKGGNAKDGAKKKSFPPATDEAGRIVCLFCRVILSPLFYISFSFLFLSLTYLFIIIEK